MLTGGASQLSGVRELSALVLDKQVRMGRPLRIHGLADATNGPAFATASGLLSYALETDVDAPGRFRIQLRIAEEIVVAVFLLELQRWL